jgi:hypothetical protein
LLVSGAAQEVGDGEFEQAVTDIEGPRTAPDTVSEIWQKYTLWGRDLIEGSECKQQGVALLVHPPTHLGLFQVLKYERGVMAGRLGVFMVKGIHVHPVLSPPLLVIGMRVI